MMSRKSKQELLDTVRPRYYKAGRKEKKRILDELVANTGYQRKYGPESSTSIPSVSQAPGQEPLRAARESGAEPGMACHQLHLWQTTRAGHEGLARCPGTAS